MTQHAAGLPVIDNPLCPDIFADEALSFDNINGTIRVTFGVIKPQQPVPPSPHQFATVARLVMTVPGAQRLSLALYNYLESQGLDPTALVQGDKTAQ